jgi:hypothetical protein
VPTLSSRPARPAQAARSGHVVRSRGALAALLVCALLFGLPACSSKSTSTATSTASGPTPTSSADKVKFAKTKFVANASLAAGASYQWIYKPFKAGTFKKGAKGRTAALAKAGLAGLFAYNRFKAAINDAKGDPTLSKALAPLTGRVDALKNQASTIKSGNAGDADFSQFNGTVDDIKNAAKSAGANVTNQVPSLQQIGAS